MARFDLVVFDVDDTLLDFRRSQRAAFAQCVREAAPMVDVGKAHRVYLEVSRGLWDALEQGKTTFEALATARWELLAERLGVAYDVATLSVRYLDVLATQSHVCAGAQRTVEALAAEHQLGAVTNGYEAVQAPRLAAAGLDRYLDFVLTSEAAGVAKPGRGIFEQALELAGGAIEPERVLMVGDSLSSDIAGGQQMGFVTCWVTRSPPPQDATVHPDYTVTELDEILELAR